MICWAVIVAAGRGSRAALGQNKVFYPVKGRTVLARCLDAIRDCGRFDGAVLVLSIEDEARFAALSDLEGPFEIVKYVARGGATRRDSVYNGLLLVPEDVPVVAVHDAARPFVSAAVIDATLDSAQEYGSGVICTPVVDTIKQISADGRVVSLDRNTLRAVQTPQAFDRERLLAAHRRAVEDGLVVTDDAMLFEHYYGNVHLVTAQGEEVNRKLTTKADFDALEAPDIPDIRIGQGYDAHRLAQGRRLVLCGVEIPWEKGLDGHSDADVAVHALMDALLGAAALGDIGKLFPDSAEKYKGISSMLLLEEVVRVLEEKDFSISNVDVTIIAQAPKLSPYMDEMRATVAKGLKIPLDRVSVKATTTEKMGFEGRKEGISAQAAALLMARM